MIKIAIVEDNKNDAKLLAQHIKNFQEQNSQYEISVEFFDNGFDFIVDYKAIYDIIFMDIEMPKMDGLNTARRLREVDQDVCLIFCSVTGKFAIYGYEVDAFDYLVKPVTYLNFCDKFNKALKKCCRSKLIYTLVPSEKGLIKMLLKDILYVDKDFHETVYHTVYGDYSDRKNLKEIESVFLNNNFVKPNRGCIVNVRAITEFNKDCITVNGKVIPISRAMKKDCYAALIRIVRESEGKI